MTRDELTLRTDAAIERGHHGLQKMWDEIPKGVRKQLLKDEEIKETLDIYGVKYEEGG